MTTWLDACRDRVLIIDGAMGTQLQARGMGSVDCPEQWAREHPVELAAIHGDYVKAGADIILTCTFGASSLKLTRAGLASDTEAMNWALARVARDAAPEAVILGDIGPCDEMIAPLGEKTADEIRSSFARQVVGLADVVDGFMIETMSDVDEAVLALKAARKAAPGKPVLVSMTFKKDFNGETFHTIMGVDPEQAAKRLTDAGADAVGCNCGYGIDDMVGIVERMAAATKLPIVAEPNAGLPRLVGGETVFDQKPADMAAKVGRLVSAGARIVGGCCGTTPDHIAAMKAVIEAL
ncbi:MAG: homocysteine S-methyltransferase family protein [Planctomycetes bacterium]|nr:homocysteine S-methyltransferase family protein [Planctomycetota bacterium]